MNQLYLFLCFIPSCIFFLRFLMQYTGCDAFNPACKAVSQITRPLLILSAPFAPNKKNICYGAIFWTIILGIIVPFIFWELNGGVTTNDIIPISIINLFFTLWSIIKLFFYLMVIEAILSWIVSLRYWAMFFNKLVSPILNPFEKLIPPIGGISLAFLIAFFALSMLDTYVMPMALQVLLEKIVGFF